MFCCKNLKKFSLNNDIGGHKLHLVYLPKFREWGIRYVDGALQKIDYCPWCGAKLPESLTDKWFEIIWAMGLEPNDPKIPSKYLTDEWYKEKED